MRCVAGDTVALPRGWTGRYDVASAVKAVSVVVGKETTSAAAPAPLCVARRRQTTTDRRRQLEVQPRHRVVACRLSAGTSTASRRTSKNVMFMCVRRIYTLLSSRTTSRLVSM